MKSMRTYLYLVLIFVCSNAWSMSIHVFGEDMFPNQVVHTEYKAYQLLCKDPLTAPVNYLAVPWGWLINKNMLYVVPMIKLDGGFTVCQHIKYETIIPTLKQMGIDVLFTPHVSRKKVYAGITVLPFPHFQINTAIPAHHKDILYSFIGIEWSHHVRSKIFTMKHSSNVYLAKRKKWHFWDTPENIEVCADEYKDVLARSRFALCPRGTGPSNIRFWEALGAGAIPILIADDMMLPEGIDWDAASIRVAESEVEKIPAIISGISAEKEQEMRDACLQIHELFSGDNFVSLIRDYYKEPIESKKGY